MEKERAQGLPALVATFLIAALFAFTLAGCGDQSSGSSGSSSEASQGAAESSAASGEVTFPDDLADATAEMKSIAMDADAEDAVDLSSLPSAEDQDAAKLEADEIATGLADESKAPSGQVLLYTGGVQVLVPSTWSYRADAEGWDLVSSDGRLWGGLYAMARQSGYTYDVEAMAASIPQNLKSGGFTDIQIVGFGNCYSSKGTHCSSYIQCVAQKDGMSFGCYYVYILSKSYINYFYLAGDANSFEANLSDLSSMIDSVAFNGGEEI